MLLSRLRSSQACPTACRKFSRATFPRWSDGITLILIKSHVKCHSSVKWKWITLNNLFSDTKDKPTCTSRTIEEEEETMEQAMAEALEDEQLDDGAIEIGSDEEYR